MLNVKLNDTAQKILWGEAVYPCERVRNIMATAVSTTSSFETFYGEKPKIIGLFLEFWHIGYVTKQEVFRKQMEDKKFKAIMVGYAYNDTREAYKLYNPETKRSVVNRDVKRTDL